MASELDIWRAANSLIHEHGEGAEIEAARKADLMLARGDQEAVLHWLRIKRAIAELRPAH